MTSTSTPDRSAASFPHQEGFTLLEVLISFALLLFITVLTYQKIGSSYRLRDKFVTEGDFNAVISSAMEVLHRDFSQLYSPVIMIPPKQADNAPPSVELQAAMAEGDQKKGGDYWMGVIDVTGIRASRFEGTQTSLRFVAASHVRIYRETHESIFEKVGYELRDDPHRTEALEGTRMLVKIANTNAFDPEDDEGDSLHVYPLLQGVKSLNFKYYERSRDRWHDKWDSDSQDFKYRFPDAIKVLMDVASEGRSEFNGQWMFRPEVPIYGIYPSF